MADNKHGDTSATFKLNFEDNSEEVISNIQKIEQEADRVSEKTYKSEIQESPRKALSSYHTNIHDWTDGFYEDPSVRNRFKKDYAKDNFYGNEANRGHRYLTDLSRKLDAELSRALENRMIFNDGTNLSFDNEIKSFVNYVAKMLKDGIAAADVLAEFPKDKKYKTLKDKETGAEIQVPTESYRNALSTRGRKIEKLLNVFGDGVGGLYEFPDDLIDYADRISKVFKVPNIKKLAEEAQAKINSNTFSEEAYRKIITGNGNPLLPNMRYNRDYDEFAVRNKAFEQRLHRYNEEDYPWEALLADRDSRRKKLTDNDFDKSAQWDFDKVKYELLDIKDLKNRLENALMFLEKVDTDYAYKNATEEKLNKRKEEIKKQSPKEAEQVKEAVKQKTEQITQGENEASYKIKLDMDNEKAISELDELDTKLDTVTQEDHTVKVNVADKAISELGKITNDDSLDSKQKTQKKEDLLSQTKKELEDLAIQAAQKRQELGSLSGEAGSDAYKQKSAELKELNRQMLEHEELVSRMEKDIKLNVESQKVTEDLNKVDDKIETITNEDHRITFSIDDVLDKLEDIKYDSSLSPEQKQDKKKIIYDNLATTREKLAEQYYKDQSAVGSGLITTRGSYEKGYVDFLKNFAKARDDAENALINLTGYKSQYAKTGKTPSQSDMDVILREGRVLEKFATYLNSMDKQDPSALAASFKQAWSDISDSELKALKIPKLSLDLDTLRYELDDAMKFYNQMAYSGKDDSALKLSRFNTDTSNFMTMLNGINDVYKTFSASDILENKKSAARGNLEKNPDYQEALQRFRESAEYFYQINKVITDLENEQIQYALAAQEIKAEDKKPEKITDKEETKKEDTKKSTESDAANKLMLKLNRKGFFDEYDRLSKAETYFANAKSNPQYFKNGLKDLVPEDFSKDKKSKKKDKQESDDDKTKKPKYEVGFPLDQHIKECLEAYIKLIQKGKDEAEKATEQLEEESKSDKEEKSKKDKTKQDEKTDDNKTEEVKEINKRTKARIEEYKRKAEDYLNNQNDYLVNYIPDDKGRLESVQKLSEDATKKLADAFTELEQAQDPARIKELLSEVKNYIATLKSYDKYKLGEKDLPVTFDTEASKLDITSIQQKLAKALQIAVEDIKIDSYGLSDGSLKYSYTKDGNKYTGQGKIINTKDITDTVVAQLIGKNSFKGKVIDPTQDTGYRNQLQNFIEDSVRKLDKYKEGSYTDSTKTLSDGRVVKIGDLALELATKIQAAIDKLKENPDKKTADDLRTEVKGLLANLKELSEFKVKEVKADPTQETGYKSQLQNFIDESIRKLEKYRGDKYLDAYKKTDDGKLVKVGDLATELVDKLRSAIDRLKENPDKQTADELKTEIKGYLSSLREFSGLRVKDGSIAVNFDLPASKLDFSILKEKIAKAVETAVNNINIKSYDPTTGEVKYSYTKDGEKFKGYGRVVDTVNAQGNDASSLISSNVLEGAVAESESALDKFKKGFKKKMETLAQYMGGNYILQTGINTVRNGFSDIKVLDDQLTNINMTMGVTRSELARLRTASVDLGQNLGTSATEVLNAVSIYANANETAESILEKASPTVMMAKAEGVDTSTAANQLQAVVQQFEGYQGKEREIVSYYEKISAGLAIDFKTGITGMADAVQNAGSVAEQAGSDA